MRVDGSVHVFWRYGLRSASKAKKARAGGKNGKKAAAKGQKNNKDKKKKASFRRGVGKKASNKAKSKVLSGASAMASTAAPSTPEQALLQSDCESESGVPEHIPELEFKGFSLRDLPMAALPMKDRPNKGTKSYTVVLQDGKVLIDVLLAKSAFFIKNGLKKGTVSWRKHGGAKMAWDQAVAMAGA